MTFKAIIKKIEKIKKLGWIKTEFPKNKNGGAGNTIEKLLNIKENNISLPDLGKIELKTMNIKGSSSKMLSLFNFNNKVWRMKQLEAIKKYGSKNKNGRMGIYYTLTTRPNSAGLFINVKEKQIIIQSVNGEILIEFPVKSIVQKFNQKVKSVLLVYFKREERDGQDYFLYEKAKFLSGGTNEKNIISNIKNDLITIDLRLHPRKNKSGGYTSRNHGTAFRIKDSNLQELYTNIQNISF